MAAGLVAAAAVVVASGMRLDAAGSPKDAQEKPGIEAAAQPTAGGRAYVCHVTDKGTGKPIAGASVLVRLSLFNDPKTGRQRTLAETRQVTDAEGAYRITITPEQAAERSLFAYIDINHPGYLKNYGGYGFGMIEKNEKLGERPFFEDVKLLPGKAIEGRLVTPEGTPLAGVNIQAFCTNPAPKREAHEFGHFTWTSTDAEGRYRLDLLPAGPAIFWILPRDYAIETHVLKDGRRGDLGTVTLRAGNALQGRVLDAQGRPVAGAYVTAARERFREQEDVPDLQGVADHVQRSVVTAADGSFTIRALPAATYRVTANEQGWDPATRNDVEDPEPRPLSGVFTAQKAILRDGETPEPMVIRAVPHVVVEAQILDSKGNKAKGHDADLFGRLDGDFWNGRSHPTRDGAYRWLAPHGLEDATVEFSTNEHTALRVRKSKDEPLENDQSLKLGTLDRDVKGLEVIRYIAPVLVVKVRTKEGTRPADATVFAKFNGRQDGGGGRRVLKGGVLSDCGFEEQADGRFRSEGLLPGEAMTVTAQAKGYASKTESLTLGEAATKESELVLEKE